MKDFKKDNAIMRLLKVNEIRHVLAHTNNGELCLCLRSGEDNYFLTLDAVPLEKDKNDEIMNLLYDLKK